MTWLLVVILAQIILGTSAVFDKIILRRKFFNPLKYTFWLGILGIFSIALLPFGFSALSIKFTLIACLAGAIFILALLCLFYALDYSEASQTLPIVGGLSPIFTLSFSYLFLNSKFDISEIFGFLILVFGGLILFATEKKELRFFSTLLIVASAFLFGFSNVLTKLVFDNSNFITGLFWMKMGGVLLVILSLVFPRIRKGIFHSKHEPHKKHFAFYFANRTYAGIGSFLVYFAISLAHPALVDAVQSFKYVVIFFAAWLILRERFNGRILTGKILATIFISFGLVWIGMVGYFKEFPANPERHIDWGLTYSTKFTQQLGLDWQETYSAILKDLHPQKVRLVVYWSEIEKEPGKFDFSQVDWLIQKSKEKNVSVILATGLKAPRWPECFNPDWTKVFSSEKKEEALRNYLKEVIERYKGETTIKIWQIENEPFLLFGQCPKRSEIAVEEEVRLVKSLDPSRSILLTDGGEFGLWYKAVKMGDIFGTTMYRNVYINSIGWLVDNIEYPLTPDYFRLKEKMIRFITNEHTKPFIVIELQGEPWSHIELPQVSIEKQTKLFSPDYFADTIKYAKEAGFDEYYLWGAEWWYWMKIKNNHPEYWELAKNLIGH